MKKEAVATVDGSSLGRRGPGGWCTILQINGKKLFFSGFVREPDGTSSRMEILAARMALEHIQKEFGAISSAIIRNDCAKTRRMLNEGKGTRGADREELELLGKAAKALRARGITVEASKVSKSDKDPLLREADRGAREAARRGLEKDGTEEAKEAERTTAGKDR